ncbi:MAG: hypothetical protein LBR51_02775 [Bacteroidales bacterium]|jgi:hypothetical protein|nr:hypothetical protein [Bacteroidales bacterium]
MKKLFLVLAVAGLAISFASCKKECICTTTTEYLGAAISASASAGEMSVSDCEALSVGNVVCKAE